MQIKKYNKKQAQKALKKLLAHTPNGNSTSKSVNIKRLEAIVYLMEDNGEANLKKVMDDIFLKDSKFPESSKTSKKQENPSEKQAALFLNSLSKMAKDIENKAKENNKKSKGFNLKLHKDNYKKKPVEERNVWLEGDDSTIENALNELENSIAVPNSKVENIAVSDIKEDIYISVFFPNKNQVKVKVNMVDELKDRIQNRVGDKISSRYFVSYSHKTEKLAIDLLDKLQDQMGLSKYFKFEKLIDCNIVVGENWNDRIQKQIQECDFGLLLLSANFFSSDYIIEKELIHFVNNKSKKIEITKPIVPVGLESFSLDGDLKGLEHVTAP